MKTVNDITYFGARLLLGALVGVIAVGLLLVILIVWSAKATAQRTHDDVVGMDTLIKQNLPLGSSVTQVHMFLRSPKVTTYLQSRGFDTSLINSNFQFKRTAQLNESSEQSQISPQGTFVFVWLNPA